MSDSLVGVTPFSKGYGSIAEHQFSRNWYNTRYSRNIPTTCIIPEKIDYKCIRDQLTKSTSNSKTITLCTEPQKIDPSCPF